MHKTVEYLNNGGENRFLAGHRVGKVFDDDGELIGGSIFLSREEVEELESEGDVLIELK